MDTYNDVTLGSPRLGGNSGRVFLPYEWVAVFLQRVQIEVSEGPSEYLVACSSNYQVLRGF